MDWGWVYCSRNTRLAWYLFVPCCYQGYDLRKCKKSVAVVTISCNHLILSDLAQLVLRFSLLLLQAKQLKDYENAVIAKRLEELDEDELQALVEEVDKDDF